jgi:hypothetical protein
MSDTDVSYCVNKMAAFPTIYKTGHQTPSDILKQSDYQKLYSLVTLDKICQYLLQNPTLVSDWLQYSEDIRHSPAWSIGQDDTNKWIVVYSGKGILPERYIYDDKFEACSKMIKMTFESIRSSAL